MNLRNYDGKNVVIIATGGEIFTGFVQDYFFPEDNDNGKESIVLKTHSGDFIEFNEDTIEKITIQ